MRQSEIEYGFILIKNTCSYKIKIIMNFNWIQRIRNSFLWYHSAVDWGSTERIDIVWEDELLVRQIRYPTLLLLR